jgi:tetratricopeptide (TPR) repeat protein
MALFKKRERLPEIKRGSGSGRGTGPLFRRNRMPTITSYTDRYRRRGGLVWGLIAAGLVALILVIAAPAWLPLIQVIVPDRYIMAYAPEPLQPVIFDIDPDAQVPTPAGAPDGAAISMLASMEPPPAPAVTPTPAPVTHIPATPGGGSYVQPTRVAIAATPTVTPAAAAAVDARAVDRENSADLSHVDELLTGFNFQQQTGSNNCGPASYATMISYWGVDITMTDARGFLKPNPDDPNVRPDEMVNYSETLGYQMIVRENGSLELLKRFILAGYPVMLEMGYNPEPDTYGWMSHFLTIAGYSERDGGFIAMDTYRRPNWYYPYEEIEQYWRQFNRRYLVAYRPDQAAAIASIIGEDMDDAVMYTNAMHTAQSELSLDREDPFAWFNLGTSLVGLGRYEDAANAFDEARRIGLPGRFLWYQFTPFEAYLQVGRYEDVETLADNVLSQIATEEPFYYKGMALLAQGEDEEAARQFNLALRFNRNYEAASRELERLEG